MEEWQTKRSSAPGTPRLSAVSAITTGFLDGTHPIVDAYELKVRPEPHWARLACLGGPAATPSCSIAASVAAETLTDVPHCTGFDLGNPAECLFSWICS